LSDPTRTTEAFVAVETRQLTMAGPFELVQGGVAMVGRQPIYLAGAGNIPDLDPDFWGFATVLIYLDDFFEASRIDELGNDGYGYEIAKFDRDENRFTSFWGSGPITDPVSVDVPIENGTWRLSLGRADGWGQSGWSTLQLFVAAVLALAGGVAVLDFQRRRARLEAVVAERTRDLQVANVELEQARDDAERASQAKTAFLSNVSHELRTPMNAILGFAELIDTDQLAEADADSLTHIRQAGSHLLELINEVLDVTAIESGTLRLDPEPVDVDDLLREVHTLLRPLADSESVQLTCVSAGAVALAHHHRLFQVVSNLVANALRFTPSGGRVRIFTELDDEECHIVVADTGVGIAEEHMDRIFQPFERGDAPAAVAGTGLGLAIVARLVDAMGGVVQVDSMMGIGSTFTVSLARLDPSVRPEPGATSELPSALVTEG
ncbi:MAG: ATP-binding protein, partial [Acidimicrobiia bacterium]|nr:ATP-binding protein [Acidimicrobiia bacterium]